jgi:hypothetical protein
MTVVGEEETLYMPDIIQAEIYYAEYVVCRANISYDDFNEPDLIQAEINYAEYCRICSSMP